MTDHVITEYGARPDQDCTQAIELAIKARPCPAALDGAIRLLDRLWLQLLAF